MDPIAIAFYAVICGCLSIVAPNLGGMVPRLAVGAVVGIVASVALPFARAAMGGAY